MKHSLKIKLITALIVFLVSLSLFLGIAYQFGALEGTTVLHFFPKDTGNKEDIDIAKKIFRTIPLILLEYRQIALELKY